MTYEERLKTIKTKKAAVEAAKDKEKELKASKSHILQTEISGLTTRIQELIKLGNACLENEIKLPDDSETAKFGYGDGYKSYDFNADGIHHHVGFLYKNKKICYLGIKNGGYNGPFDFYTDGEETFSKANTEYGRNNEIYTASIANMEKFLEEFPKFEAAFYKWIDSMNEEATTAMENFSKEPDLNDLAHSIVDAFDGDCAYIENCLPDILKEYEKPKRKMIIDKVMVCLTGCTLEALIKKEG